MNAHTHPKHITLSDLRSKSHSYALPKDTGNKPGASLSNLDAFRYDDLPTNLRDQRKEESSTTTKPAKNKKHPSTPSNNVPRSPFLSKSDLTKLTVWKLKHGTFRPRLLTLVTSNSDEEIKSVTTKAFETHAQTSREERSTTKNPSKPKRNLDDDDDSLASKIDHTIKALTHLTTLKGVGPATASLALSCFDPTNVPFFSDEVFRWLHFDDTLVAETDVVEQPLTKKRKTANTEQTKVKGGKGAKGAGTAGGWGRKISYSAKEYRSLLERWEALRRRLEDDQKGTVEKLQAWEVEKAAYVMFREECGGG